MIRTQYIFHLIYLNSPSCCPVLLCATYLRHEYRCFDLCMIIIIVQFMISIRRTFSVLHIYIKIIRKVLTVD